ncbi:MAG: hypothetical protein NC548_28680 [Lachnospiraceae bacterium]|nr:hypothetical protein [Lachnospiraceae bacterium]
MLRGERGINKMRLAMQMLHGISRSVYAMSGFAKHATVPYFFSLNKTEDNLADMFLDYLITRQIDHIIKDNSSKIHTQWQHDLLSKSLFLIEGYTERSGNREYSFDNLPKDFRACMDKYLCNRTIYYNNRTNALHFLREFEGDDNDNLLFRRRSDKLHDYWKEGRNMLKALPKEMQEDFFDVRFNEHDKSDGKEDKSNTIYPSSASLKFQKILDCMENMELDVCNKYDKDKTESSTESSKGSFVEQYSPCLVIDGFAQLTNDELTRLHFPHIEKVLRRLSMVSILVFDERAKHINCNADIIIDMRTKENATEGYIFHELQITKSVFQPAAFGWHKYKVRNCGVEVYPSIHRLLQRRNYMSQILTHTHAGILEEGYGRYMRTEQMRNRHSNETDLSYETYQKDKYDREMELLKEMFRKNEEVKERCATNDANVHYAESLLKLLLLGSERNSTAKKCFRTTDSLMRAEGDASRWREYEPTTALIGNPNSFKRFLTIANVFRAAKQREHTLIILFDKEEDEMRRQFVCPGAMIDKKTDWPCFYESEPSHMNDTCSTCCYKCKLRECCHKCYQYIHFFNVRMGCISADELFSVLKEQIELSYIGENKEGRLRKIIIDDLQKIDYSFPLLKEERLFLTALVMLCRENDVELQILCDKKAGLTKELCSLVDNVICIQRNQEDLNKIILYIERFGEHIAPSEIHQYEITDVLNLFKCNGMDFELNARFEPTSVSKISENEIQKHSTDASDNKELCHQAIIAYKRIGSMREYWRKRVGVVKDIN